MISQERTQDVFEYIEGYPKPPFVPLADINQFKIWRQTGFKESWFSKFVIKSVVKFSGFEAFYDQLPSNLEEVLRKNNARLPGLFAPLISATLLIKDDPACSSPTERAASLILAARSLYKDLYAGKLKPDQYKDSILEMGQYPNLFSTCLFPGTRGVRLYKSLETYRFTLAIAQKFYSLEIGDINSEIKFDQLKNSLDNVIEKALKNPLKQDEPPVGILTSASNRLQFKVFDRIRKRSLNKKSLHLIKNSFLTICFDTENEPKTDGEAAYLAHIGNFENRWQHSSIQFVVFGNAKAAIICNFTAYLDGNTMMRSASEFCKRGLQISKAKQKAQTSFDLYPYRELKWQVNPKVISAAKKNIQMIVDNQKASFEIFEIGRSFFELHQVAAVPTFILALQFATKKLTGKIVKISQFLSMSKFRCMDLTETVVTTNKVKKFINYFESREFNTHCAKELLISANESQIKKYRDARRYLPLMAAISLFVRSKIGIGSTYVSFLFFLAFRMLRILKLYFPERREVIISHPEIYPEVTIVGRPGVKIPYTKYYGLHYQIFQEKIVLTMMPGMKWTVSNLEFISVFKESLFQICEIIKDENKD